MPSLLRGFEKDYPNIRIDIYQGSYDDVYQWLKDGIVDLGFLSSTSAGDLSCTPIYQDKIICVAPRGFKKQRFVTQREGCDADVNHVMNKYDLPGGGGSYIADDMSAVSLVMGGFGVCLMPELVIRNIPFPVDVIPLEVEEKRTIVLAYVRSDVLAPAVQKMQSYILESFQKKAEEEQ